MHPNDVTVSPEPSLGTGLLRGRGLALALASRRLDLLRNHLMAEGDPNATVMVLDRPSLTSPCFSPWLEGDRLLHVAIALAWPEAVTLLLAHGADPEALSRSGGERTPVGRTVGPIVLPVQPHPLVSLDTPASWCAISAGRLKILQALLQAGAMAHRPVDGQTFGNTAPTPIVVACEHRLFDAWALLHRHRERHNVVDSRTVLKHVVREARVRWLAHWLKVGGDPDEVVDSALGLTVLHMACVSPHAKAPDMVKLLLRYVARNGQDQEAIGMNRASLIGNRPLHLAFTNARQGAMIARLLLDAGANPTLKGAGGTSVYEQSERMLRKNPLHEAARVVEHHRWSSLAIQAALGAEHATGQRLSSLAPRQRL